MQYTDEEKRILRTARTDAFCAGFRRGCCMTGFIMSIMTFMLFSMCGNKPMDKNYPHLNKKPQPVQKATLNIKKLKTTDHTR